MLHYMRYWVGLVLIAHGAFVGICHGEDTISKDHLAKVWTSISGMRDGIKPESEAFQIFRLGSHEVDAFLEKKLGTICGGRLEGAEMNRMAAVIAANKEKGCIWLLYQSRVQSIAGRSETIRAGKRLPDYQEVYQYLVSLLIDPTITPRSTFGAVAPRSTYPWRICDLAYIQLMYRLRRTKTDTAASNPATKPFSFSATMPHAKRDKQIAKLVKWFKTEKTRRFASSRPSALEALKKSKEMTAEVKAAERILGRCRPKLIKLTIPKEETTLSALLDNEQPPLTAKEKKTRERLLKKEYSAKDVVSRLPQSRLRDRGLIEWVILHRKDRMDIATSLIAMYEGNEYQLMKLPLIDLMGELLRTWKSVDKPAAKKITEFVKKISTDEKTHWTVKEVVLEILSVEIQIRGKN